MNRLLCTVLVLAFAAGPAAADELGDANQLMLAKSYDKALAAYAKLAEAGNAEAQFRLAEMYWYGDGTAPDMAQATAWLQKAAAAGHAQARQSQALLEQRKARGVDVAYWTTRYNGEDLVSGKFACPPPAIPAVSHSNDEIKAVTAAINDWQACYNGFAANFNDALPPGKRIPADVASMMTPREAEMARAHLKSIYGQIFAAAQAGATETFSQRDAWRHATEDYVKAQNSLAEADRKQYELQLRQAEMNQGRNMQMPVPVPTAPTSSGHR